VQILINNVGELKKYETAVTGTNVAIEQAAINTDNNNAKLAQAKNRLNVMSIELGEKLAPALTISTNGLSYMIKGLSATISFFNEFKGVIIPAVTAIVSYGLAVKVAAMWEERNNAAKGAGLVLSKLKVFWHAAERGALLLTAAAQALLTGNIGRATAAMRVFNAVTKLNPYALIASLIIAAGTALVMYTRRLSEAEIAQKAVNDVNLEAKKSIVEEKIKLESLLDIAKNEKLSKEERLKAIRALNAISPQYLGNLTLESINTDNAKKSVDEYVESLLQKARVQAAQEKLAEIEKERLDQLASGEDKATSFWQKIGASMASNGDAMVYQRLLETQSTENATKANDIYLAKVKAVKDIIGQDAPAVPTGNSTGTENEIKAGQDLIKIKERELEAAKLVPATTAAEVAARNRKVEAIQNEINKLNELGTSKEGSADSDIAKKKLKALEAANDKEISLINKKHLEGKLSEDEYQNDLLKQELKFLSDKASIYKAGSKEYEDAMMQSLAKQVEAQKKVKDLILEAQKELTDAKIENLQEGLEKERAIEEARWQDEMQRLKEKLIVHDDLSEDEKKHNDIVNQTIQAKTEAHQKKLTDIIKGGEIQKLLELALLHDAKAQTDEEHYAAERETAQAQYQQEIKDANGNASKIAQAEKNLSQKLINIKLEELNKRQEIGNAIFSAGNELFGALVQLAGKESALGKAMFILQQANAVGQIIFNTAIANSKAVAAMPFTGGQPWVTINTISAAVSIASVLAQTIASFAGGGYTGDGGKYDEAGTVHKGEYVIPQEGVKNPNLLPVISSIESARKSNRLRTLDLREDVASGMWSYQPPMAPTGASSGVRSTEVMTVSDPETKALLQENARTNRELTEELQKMRKEGIKGVFNRFGKNSIAEEMKEISKFNSKVSKS
jgi:hypothetical protein